MAAGTAGAGRGRPVPDPGLAARASAVRRTAPPADASPVRRHLDRRQRGSHAAHEPGRYPVAYFPLGDIADDVLALYESGFAPRWYVPRADVDESALTAVDGQTFCPYKGLCSYYDIGAARRAAWSCLDAWPEVGRVAGFISFEPDKVEVSRDGRRLRLEPGQSVIAHGVDRDLSAPGATGPSRTR